MKKIKLLVSVILLSIIVGFCFIPDEIHAEKRDSITIEHVVKVGESFYSISEDIIEEYDLKCSPMGLQFCIREQNDWKGDRDPRTLQPGTLLVITIEK